MMATSDTRVASLDEIAAHPSIVKDLSPQARALLTIRVAGILAAIGGSVGTESVPDERDPRLLSAQETAERLGFKLSYVYELARRQRIASVRCGKYVRFRESDVEEFSQRNRKPVDARWAIANKDNER